MSSTESQLEAEHQAGLNLGVNDDAWEKDETFHHSAKKLNSAQPFSSSSSDVSECSSVSGTDNDCPVSSIPSIHDKGTKAVTVTHSTTTPSMAQLRARKIMSEARKLKLPQKNSLPISPTCDGSDYEEASTDNSPHIDVETVAHVSYFIDSLQKRPITAPDSHQHVKATTRYQSSLANARHAMAASPMSNSCSPRIQTQLVDETESMPLGDSSKSNNLGAIEAPPFNLDSSFPESQDPFTSFLPFSSAHTPEDRAVLDCETNVRMKKDVNYYAVLAQVQKVVRTEKASASLGKILANANKRGIPLDVVTEMYKQERFKTSSETSNSLTGSCDDTDASYIKLAAQERLDVINDCLEACTGDHEVSSSFADGTTRSAEAGKAPSDFIEKVESSMPGGGDNYNDVVGLSSFSKDARTLFNEQPVEFESYSGNPGTQPKDMSHPESQRLMSNSLQEHHVKILPNVTFIRNESRERECMPHIGEHCVSNNAALLGEDLLRNNCEVEVGVPGLNESQHRQLNHLVKKAEELREADLSPQVCINDAIKLSMEYTGTNVHSSGSHAKKREKVSESTSMNVDDMDDIDAFLSRFSIEDGELAECRHSQSTIHHNSVHIDIKENSSEPIALQSGDAQVKQLNAAGQGSSTSVCIEGFPLLGTIDPKEYRKLKLIQKSAEKKGNLPNHLGLWKSPWRQRNRLAHSIGLDSIIHSKSIITACDVSKQNKCLLPLQERVVGHSGYLNIDFYSLYEASVVRAKDEDIDRAPWEYRDVGQRFLHEKSLESRNWFGSFELKRGNDRVHNPVCVSKSVEVLVTRIPKPGEWSEDWYTTWKSRKDNPNNLVMFAQGEILVESEHEPFLPCERFAQSPLKSNKVMVEIGSLCPVRVRGGERVSRIHPEFTSSLRQSRWRKKYLKRSMFPAD